MFFPVSLCFPLFSHVFLGFPLLFYDFLCFPQLVSLCFPVFACFSLVSHALCFPLFSPVPLVFYCFLLISLAFLCFLIFPPCFLFRFPCWPLFLYVSSCFPLFSCQRRKCDLHEFFQYENQSFPASSSDNGKLYNLCEKSQLVEILWRKGDYSKLRPTRNAIIINGSAIVNASPLGKSKTLIDEYVRENLLPKVKFYSRKCKRTNIVTDSLVKEWNKIQWE